MFSYTSVAFLSLLSVAASTILPRQNQSPETGSLVSPTSGTEIAPGASFAFEYGANDWCHQGYSNFVVYLTPGPDAPTYADVTSTAGNTQNSEGELEEGTYLYNFGRFLVANFGLPSMGTPPPSTLTMPNLLMLNGTSYSDATFYITVVESFSDCPPNIPLEIGLTSNQVIYNATSST